MFYTMYVSLYNDMFKSIMSIISIIITTDYRELSDEHSHIQYVTFFRQITPSHDST